LDRDNWLFYFYVGVFLMSLALTEESML
jgi:hypothetical protein